MMRWLALIALVACSAPPAPAGVAAPEAPSETPREAPPEAPPPAPAPDAAPPPPPPPAAPVLWATVISTETVSNGTIVTVDKGSNDGVAVGWRATLLDSSGNPVQGGSFLINKVKARASYGVSSLPIQAVNSTGLRVGLGP